MYKVIRKSWNGPDSDEIMATGLSYDLALLQARQYSAEMARDMGRAIRRPIMDGYRVTSALGNTFKYLVEAE